MFIGHIPAGYLSTKVLLKVAAKYDLSNDQKKWLLYTGILASILPDFDMLYFNFIDNMKHLHHGYWTHIPFFWACIFVVWYILSFAVRSIPFGLYGYVILINIFLHLFLDTIVGKVRWLYPFSAYDVVIFNIPSVYKWWVWNFVFHWTFLFEIGLVLIAAFFIVRSLRFKNIG
ncbi:MAG TPA: hypothetical protein DCQ37_02745 [Desulfobacteraceae bacterium]|nr:hypothetical protein [Desulfobacteraceae bacterium]